ncbi:hypothetical protein BKI52_11340 [marine bacterium AO1-C]|nr:hypothetical protein BKI52_11340 [marine bacterium AO1-C]
MVRLRDEIEPQVKLAEKIYSKVLAKLLDYTTFVDTQGDENNEEYEKVVTYLSELTGKDIANRDYAIWEYWEADGEQRESFKIALPDPVAVENITLNEVTEIVTRIVQLTIPAYLNTPFVQQNGFVWEISNYYHQFLKLNFKKYTPSLFNRQKNKQGEWYEPGIEDIASALWG